MSWPAGECTYYAASRFPVGNAQLGNALTWASKWKALGHATTMIPTAGTVACFQPGVEGAQGTGHVAYVESVQPDGSFTISEMNCSGCGNPPGGFGKVDYRSGLKPSLGVSFLLPPAANAQTAGGVNGLTTTTVDSTTQNKGASILGAIGDLTGISGLIGTLINGGEVVFGGVLALVGLYLLSKDTLAGQAVGTATSPVRKAGGAALDLVPGGKAVKAPLKTAKAAQTAKRASKAKAAASAASEARHQRRRAERNEDARALNQERAGIADIHRETAASRASEQQARAQRADAPLRYSKFMSDEARRASRRSARRRPKASEVPF